MSRTILALVAVGGVFFAVALGVAWRSNLGDQALINQAAKPAVSATPAPSDTKPAPNPSPAPAIVTPTFDVARIGTDGRAVIAGRAAPGAKVVLLDGGKEIAQGEADARGEWVLLAQDPPLSPGQHELRAVQHVVCNETATTE